MILIGILILLVPAGLHQLWDYIEIRRLVAEIEAVIAKGEPVTETQGFARWSFKGWRSGERDAGAHYLAAGMIAPPLSRINLSGVPLQEWLAGAGSEPGPEVSEQLRVLVNQSREALALADKAAGLSYSRLPPGTEYNYRDSHVLLLAQLISARTLSLSWSGDGDAAVNSALSALKLRRPLTELRWPLARAFANHETGAILSLSRPSPAALLTLQSALEAEDARDQVLDGLLLERARAIEGLWRRHYGPDPDVPHDYRLPTRSVMQTIGRPLTTRRAVRMMRTWTELIDVARKPWPERIAAAEALQARYPQPPSGSPGLMFLGELPTPVLITPRVVVMDRTAIAALAIERFRRDNAGALPAGLTQLVPQYLPDVPADPYSGGNMLFARDAASYTVYSVGPDRRDDGGDLRSVQQQGNRRVRGRDAGVRVLIRTD